MRRLVLVFTLLLLAPASAEAAVCAYTPPPPKLSKAEAFLRQTIEQRKGWTLPHGRDYVRRVNASQANQDRGYLILDFPMTAREAAYFKRRDRLTQGPEIRRLDRYMRRHRKLFGEVSIEDDFPRPYLQVRVKRDLAKHRAAVRRVYPFRFKLKRVAFSEPELSRIRKAIDDEALAAEGIHVVTSGQSADGINLRVATTRPDVHEVVARMYGPAVTVTVFGPTPRFLMCDFAEAYRVEPDGRTLTVHFSGSGSNTPKEIEVIEEAGEVRVGPVVETGYVVTADRQPYSLTVTLSAPLGERVVKDIRTGTGVPPR
jgi:hypothetical protein